MKTLPPEYQGYRTILSRIPRYLYNAHVEAYIYIYINIQCSLFYTGRGMKKETLRISLSMRARWVRDGHREEAVYIQKVLVSFRYVIMVYTLKRGSEKVQFCIMYICVVYRAPCIRPGEISCPGAVELLSGYVYNVFMFFVLLLLHVCM